MQGMTYDLLFEFLHKIVACEEAVSWVQQQQRDELPPRACWDGCPEASWMLYALDYLHESMLPVERKIYDAMYLKLRRRSLAEDERQLTPADIRCVHKQGFCWGRVARLIRDYMRYGNNDNTRKSKAGNPSGSKPRPDADLSGHLGSGVGDEKPADRSDLRASDAGLSDDQQ